MYLILKACKIWFSTSGLGYFQTLNIQRSILKQIYFISIKYFFHMKILEKISIISIQLPSAPKLRPHSNTGAQCLQVGRPARHHQFPDFTLCFVLTFATKSPSSKILITEPSELPSMQWNPQWIQKSCLLQ